nr:ABC transporter I family member 10, chloroplastic [Tanacetum cinerariifolium]
MLSSTSAYHTTGGVFSGLDYLHNSGDAYCGSKSVGLGRFNVTNDETKLKVAKALTAVGIYDYLQRSVQTLSGGQKQSVRWCVG